VIEAHEIVVIGLPRNAHHMRIALVFVEELEWSAPLVQTTNRIRLGLQKLLEQNETTTAKPRIQDEDLLLACTG
jgi:hypothetical protein